MNEWLNKCTWIIWHQRSPTGILDLVWNPEANDGFPFDDLNYIGYQRRSLFTCSHIKSLSTTRTQPTEEMNEERSTPDKPVRTYYLLQFWTLSAFFWIKMIDSCRGIALVWDSLDDRSCGRVFLDGLEDNQFHEYDGAFEFIILFLDSKWLDNDTGKPGYNVMYIEWMGDFAELRGIGFISTESVVHSCAPGPIWKEIVLG